MKLKLSLIAISILSTIIFTLFPSVVFATSIMGHRGYLSVGGNGSLSIGGNVPIIVQGASPSIGLNSVTYLSAVPSDTSISLTWHPAINSKKTLINYSTSAYPISPLTDTQAYFGSGLSYVLKGLTAGTTYYFSAWGFDGTNYSATAYNSVMTTVAGDVNQSSNIPAPNQPPPSSPSSSTWFTNLQPFSGIVQNFEQSWGMATDNMQFTMGILILLLVGILLYVKTKSSFIAIGADFVIDFGLIALHLLSPYTIGVVIAFGLGIWGLENIWI